MNSTELTPSEMERFIERSVRWIGPFPIDQLLDITFAKDVSRPPETDSVYVISVKPWTDLPVSGVLYVGGTMGNNPKRPRFRVRIGDLVADVFGFYNDVLLGGHHSGGQSIRDYCRDNHVNPRQLFVGWVSNCHCHRCAEYVLWEYFNQIPNDLLNRNTPPKCKEHEGKEREHAFSTK